MSNTVTIRGNLTEDVVLTTLHGPTPKAIFRIADERLVKGAKQTQFIDCMLPESCALKADLTKLTKGAFVDIKGTYNIREREYKGKTYKNHNIVVFEIAPYVNGNGAAHGAPPAPAEKPVGKRARKPKPNLTAAASQNAMTEPAEEEEIPF